MKCEEVREQMLELATAEGTPEVAAHLQGCAGCAAELREMRKTMALLDEWQAPEPSPFFQTRLKARVREIQQEEARPAWSLQWLRKPALAATIAAVLVVGGAGGYTWMRMHPANRAVPSVSAVNDLQVLQQDQDMLNNFDALDDGDTPSDSAQ